MCIGDKSDKKWTLGGLNSRPRASAYVITCEARALPLCQVPLEMRGVCRACSQKCPNYIREVRPLIWLTVVVRLALFVSQVARILAPTDYYSDHDTASFQVRGAPKGIFYRGVYTKAMSFLHTIAKS